jgi:hypothetical protein
MISPRISAWSHGGRKVSALAVGVLGTLLLSASVAPAQTPLRGPPIAFRPSTTAPFPQPGVIIFGPSIGPQGFGIGPQRGARFSAQLLPQKATAPLLNNGSLAVWLNPVPEFPNTIAFSYFASIPVGDRLGKNGVVYDAELTNNIGFSPTLPIVGANATFANFLFPSIPPISNNVVNFGAGGGGKIAGNGDYGL